MNTPTQATKDVLAEQIERVLITGDLSRLSAEQRVLYYNQVCESIGLNPLTRPFEYLKLGGKEVLYARKDCTEQLRKIHGISIIDIRAEHVEGVYVVRASAGNARGRTDASMGAVTIKGLSGEALANAMMRAETKAKRRVTLSICGLGMLDESELEGVVGAERVEEPKRNGTNGHAPKPSPDPIATLVPQPAPGMTAGDWPLQANVIIKGENLQGRRLKDIGAQRLSWMKLVESKWRTLPELDRQHIERYLDEQMTAEATHVSIEIEEGV